MPIKYELPPFLDDAVVARQVYVRWLHRKAQTHARRDGRRWGRTVRVSRYKQAIHRAVLESNGRDFYTHEKLDWFLISSYDNRDSQSQGVKYKKRFAFLPTVDHADPESRQADFRICGWRTNDCKNDLTMEELRMFCEAFLGAQAAGGNANAAGLFGRRA